MRRQIMNMALVTLFAVPVLAAADDAKKPAADPAMDAMMAEWAKYAMPGAQHKLMEKQLGKWTIINRMWMDPAQPATESKGTCEVTSVLGGRYFRSDYKGDMMGMPFEGIGISGYDIYKQQYIGSWIDNMGTMMMNFTGTCNADGSECTYTTSFDCPMTKTIKSVREVCRWTGPDSWTMDWYETTPGVPERKTMEIAHVRVK